VISADDEHNENMAGYDRTSTSVSGTPITKADAEASSLGSLGVLMEKGGGYVLALGAPVRGRVYWAPADLLGGQAKDNPGRARDYDGYVRGLSRSIYDDGQLCPIWCEFQAPIQDAEGPARLLIRDGFIRAAEIAWGMPDDWTVPGKPIGRYVAFILTSRVVCPRPGRPGAAP
jgi:hypothetical protein